MKSRSWVLCVLLLSCLGAGHALASEDSSEASTEEAESGSVEVTIDAYGEFVTANRLASAGALTRSIPHYRKVITHEPLRYPLAHFNLAEVMMQRKDCVEATLLYGAYLALGEDEEVRKQAREGIASCHAGQQVGRLKVEASPEASILLLVNGYILARHEGIEALALLPGTYEVSARAPDHYGVSKTVVVKAGEVSEVPMRLEMQTFHGAVMIDVDRPGATIRLHPRELSAPGASTEVIEVTSPLEEPVKLVTGKYFLEVTLDGYRRWIRNIEIHRDQTLDVSPRLRAELPAEIR